MEYVKLGNSDLMVSKVLECMGFDDADKGIHTWTLPYGEYEDIKKIMDIYYQ